MMGGQSMRQETVGVTENLLKSATEEFLEKGFIVDSFFIHVYCRVGWQMVYELVAHDCSYKEAQSLMNSTKLFNIAGWKAVMGIDE